MVFQKKKRITKALIRLRGSAGWSAPVLFADPRGQVFSREGPRGGGGTLIFSPYVGSDPASALHPKIISGISSTPKKYLKF